LKGLRKTGLDLDSRQGIKMSKILGNIGSHTTLRALEAFKPLVKLPLGKSLAKFLKVGVPNY
jgi:hypothetical protein